MDKVIRISSEQGFSASWNSAAGGGVAPTNLNLCDFRIPRGLIVDLSKSYIAFNTQIRPTIANNFTSADDPINANMVINGLVNADAAIEVPNSCLIKNAHIDCDKGQIESIRRVDTLRSTLWNIEHDAEERKDDMNAFTAPKQIRGTKNQTSFFLDPVVNNTDDAGAVITGRESRNLTRDVKVMIKDIFGIGEAEDWNTDKFGETRIHLETNWKDVRSYQLGGFEDVSMSFDQTNQWGKCETQMGLSNVAPNNTTNTLELSFAYDDYQQYCPFFEGQHILVSATSSAGGGPADVSAVIASMKYDPATAHVTITTAAAWFTNGAGGPINLSAIKIKSDIAVTPQMTVNRAELVLYTKPPMPTEDSYEYVTYTLEQDNGNGLDNFARGYVMEPSARNMIVCLNAAGNKLPTTEITSYRYAVNNEGMTGNRDIAPNTPIQYDRLTRCLDSTGMGLEWRNAQLKWFENAVAVEQPDSYARQCSPICETLMLTDRPKYVDLEITSAGNVLADIYIYKQHVKSI